MKTIISEKTIAELKEQLQQLDQLTIIELLDISSEELCEFLSDQIEYKYDQLLEYFDDTEDNEED